MPASYSSSAYAHKEIISGNHDLLLSKKVTILSGQNLTMGAVLGAVALGNASAAAKSGGNTGDGTITMDATTPVQAGAKLGVYAVRCIEAVTNGGRFEVRDPDGFVIGNTIEITGGAGGTGAFDDDIKFVLTDAATDFALGDGFDVTIAAGSGKYLLSLAAAVDGSQVPDAILAEDCDASGGDKEAMVYERGDFIEDALTIGTGHTAATIREGLRTKGIFMSKRTSV